MTMMVALVLLGVPHDTNHFSLPVAAQPDPALGPDAPAAALKTATYWFQP